MKPATSGNIRQHPATSGNIRQHPATSGNIRQHPATSGNIRNILFFQPFTEFPASELGLNFAIFAHFKGCR